VPDKTDILKQQLNTAARLSSQIVDAFQRATNALETLQTTLTQAKTLAATTDHGDVEQLMDNFNQAVENVGNMSKQVVTTLQQLSKTVLATQKQLIQAQSRGKQAAKTVEKVGAGTGEG